MANRYVVASGSWSAANTAIWSAVSGGAPGASVPTTADAVIMDANSGAAVVTIPAGGNNGFASLTTTGFAGTLDASALASWSWDGAGALVTFGAGMTFVPPTTIVVGAALVLHAISIDAGGHDVGQVQLQANLTLLGDIKISAGLYLYQGSMDANGHNVDAGAVLDQQLGHSFPFSALTMGSGTWTIRPTSAGSLGGAGYFRLKTSITALSPGTSTLKVVMDPVAAGVTPYTMAVDSDAPMALHDVWVVSANTAGSAGSVGFNAAITCNDFRDDADGTVSISGAGTNTLTAATMEITGGTAPSPVHIGQGFGTWTLSVAAGTVDVLHAYIQNCHAVGGALFLAGDSTDAGGNAGWVFYVIDGRYWVGGTAAWDAVAGAKWAKYTGGPGGLSVPGLTNAAVFDANSGAGTVTCSGVGACKYLDASAFVGTLTRAVFGAGQELDVYGDVMIGAGVTLGDLQLHAKASGSLASNGLDVLSLQVDAGAFVVVGDLTVSGTTRVNGTASFDAQGNYLLLGSFFAAAGTTVHLGTNEWDPCTATGGTFELLGTVDGNAFLFFQESPGLPTVVRFAGQVLPGEMEFVSWDGTGDMQFDGSVTCAHVYISTGTPFPISFWGGAQITADGYSIAGGLGAVIDLRPLAGGTWNIVCPVAGPVTADYVRLEHSHASGAADFHATNSVDAGGNVNWDFGVPPAPPFVPGLFFGNPF